MSGATPPFAPGSISFRLYPHALEPTARLAELEAQAALATGGGFDGVLISEKHGGTWGQIPNPLQASGWILASMPTGWAAPCPLLLPFRPAEIVAEELAWLAARFPGRVAAGFGSGGNEADFAALGVPFEQRTARFEERLGRLVSILSGPEGHDLSGDEAIAACHRHPIPMVSAVMSRTAARRAASLGLGMIASSLLALDEIRTLVDHYRASGGRAGHVLLRHLWIGRPPSEERSRQLADYNRASGRARGRQLAAEDPMITGHDPEAIAEEVVAAAAATDADALNLRVHVAGISPEAAREQIALVAGQVVPAIRRRWPATGAAAVGMGG